MARARFFRNPNYAEYVRLLARLQELIAQGRDEGQDGDTLRERLDEAGAEFSDEEIVSLHGLSADYCSVFADPEPPRERTPEAQADLQAALESQRAGDYLTALCLIRKNRRMIEAAQLSYIRGRLFSEAGVHDIAWRFFDHAARLDKQNINFQFIALDELKKFDFALARRNAEEILNTNTPIPPALALKAAEIRFEATRESPNRRQDRQALVAIFERIIFDFESGADGSHPQHLLPMAYAILGFCFQELDQLDESRHCFDRALVLDGNNDALLTARGILLYGRNTTQSVNDFYSALALDSKLVWPYLFLAHFYLLQERYDACLAMCRESQIRAATENVRANCYEWMAICQAMLGFSSSIVRENFDRAIQLNPTNTRIRRNRQAFDESLSKQSEDRIAWEKHEESEVRAIGVLNFRLAA